LVHLQAVVDLAIEAALADVVKNGMREQIEHLELI
jgi:hypothetical protein